MAWLGRSAHRGLKVGIGFHADGISVVKLKIPAGGTPRLLGGGFFPAGGEEQGPELTRLSRELGLRRLPAVVVLEPAAYFLQQIEAPEVTPEELPSALRWRIKDLIDFHIDDAVLDLFDLPPVRHPGAPRQLYVVAARAPLVRTAVERVEGAGLDLKRIDITELALRDLLATTSDPAVFRAMLYLAPQFGVIEVVQADTLYLRRRIEISATDLENQHGTLLDELLDALVLELQRTLDYHESQFGKGPVASLVIAAPEGARDALERLVSENLNVAAGPLGLPQRVEGIDDLPHAQLLRCLPALGAALGAAA